MLNQTLNHATHQMLYFNQTDISTKLNEEKFVLKKKNFVVKSFSNLASQSKQTFPNIKFFRLKQLAFIFLLVYKYQSVTYERRPEWVWLKKAGTFISIFIYLYLHNAAAKKSNQNYEREQERSEWVRLKEANRTFVFICI